MRRAGRSSDSSSAGYGSFSRYRPDSTLLFWLVAVGNCLVASRRGTAAALPAVLVLAGWCITFRSFRLLISPLLLLILSLIAARPGGFADPSIWLSGEPVRITARSTADSRPAASGTLLYVRLLAAEDGRGNRAQAAGRLVVWCREAAEVPWGTELDLACVSGWPPEPGNLPTVSVVPESASLAPLYRLRSGGRLRFRRRLETLQPQPAALLEALLLGRRGRLLGDLEKRFRAAGCSHLLALSGMHLAVIVSLTGLCFRLLLSRPAASLAAAALLPFYLFLVGPTPSLLRAGCMYAIALARPQRRRPAALVTLLQAGVLLLLLDPTYRSDPGFRYSFAALGGILLFGPVLRRGFSVLLPSGVASLAAAGSAAFIGTLPVTVALGGAGNPLGIVLTPLLMPVIWLYLAGGLLFALIPPVPLLVSCGRVWFWYLYRATIALLSIGGSENALPASPLFTPAAATAVGLAFFTALFYAGRRRVPPAAERNGGGDPLEFPAADTEPA